jgi:hypothetical protein
MKFQKFWGIFILLTAISIWVGCGPKPYPEIYMEPVPGRENAQVDAKTGSIIVEQKGVRITLEPLDEVELFELTKDPGINPYIGVSRWGNVEPRYTVFEIRIQNMEHPRVVVDQTALLVDEKGEQYGSLPYDYFKDLYDNVRPRTVAFNDIGYRYYFPYPRSFYYSPYRYYFYHPYRYRYAYPSYRVYDYYPDPYAVNNARMVARQTVFDGGKLFAGAKREGLLVFDRLDVGATDVKVIVPQVLIIDKKDQKSKIDFEFDFRQVVSVKE